MRPAALAMTLTAILICPAFAQELPKDEPPKDKADQQAKEGAAAATALGSLLCVGVPILLGAVLYFTPVVIALLRGHPNMAPILIVTIFLGWTVIGWIVALTWSFTAQERHRDDYGRRPRRSRRDDYDD